MTAIATPPQKPDPQEGELVDVDIWENPDPVGNGVVSWTTQYRFSREDKKTGEVLTKNLSEIDV